MGIIGSGCLIGDFQTFDFAGFADANEITCGFMSHPVEFFRFERCKVAVRDKLSQSLGLPFVDSVDKVIVFGSSMGAEAAYWGKPTILLRGMFYYYLNICYTPQTFEELNRMLREELSPKNRFPAIQYGYFILYRTVIAQPFQYIPMDTVRIPFFGKRILTTAYPTLFGSAALMQIFRSCIVIFCRKFLGRFQIPLPIFIDRITE